MSDRVTERVLPSHPIRIVGTTDRIERIRRSIERGFGAEAVSIARDPADALSREDVGCFVCDASDESIDRPIERLRERSEAPILALASDRTDAAIEAGATDVVEPDASVPVVRNRIQSVIDASRSNGGGQSRARLESIYAATSIGIVVSRDREITWASESVDRVIGYTPSELNGLDLTELLHPDDRSALTDTIASIADSPLDDSAELPCRVQHGDGHYRSHHLIAVNRLEDSAVDGIVWTIESAGPAERARERSIRSDDSVVGEESASHIERFDDPVVVLDDTWTILAANEAAASLFSAGPEDLSGGSIWERFPPDTISTWYERLTEARERGSSLSFVVAGRVDGETLSVRVYPADESTVVIVRKRAETAISDLRERLERHAMVLDAVPGPTVLVEDGRIALANAATFEHTGRDAIAGHTLSSVFGPDVAAAIESRADSRIRRIDPIEWRPGTGRVIDLSVLPLGESSAIVTGRDVTDQRSVLRGIDELAEMASALEGASNRSAVQRIVLEGVRRSQSLDHAVWYERRDSRLSPVASSSENDQLDPRPLQFDPEWFSTVGTDAATSIDSGIEIPIDDSTALAAALAVPITDSTLVLAGNAVSETEPSIDEDEAEPVESQRIDPSIEAGPEIAFEAVGFGPRALGTLSGRLGALSLAYAACRADREDLVYERDRLAALDEEIERVTERRRAIVRSIRSTETRAELESTVCEQLAAISGVGVAWIGAASGDSVVASASSGSASDYVSEVFPRHRSNSDEPAVRAISRDEPVVVEDVETSSTEDWSLIARRYDLSSMVAIPITGRTITHGVLCVNTVDAFSKDDVLPSSCADIATACGLAIDAIEARRALLSSDRLELDLSVRDGTDEPLSRLAIEMDRSILVDAVASGETLTTVYLSVHGASGQEAADVAESIDSVRAVSVLDESDNGRLELELEGPTVPDVLSEFGVTVRSIDVDDDGATIRVTLPADRSVRRVVDAVRSVVPSIELRARRPVARHADGPGRHDILGELTDRQRDVLRTAYAAGYFEWPRNRSGEEVADRLGISQPTFTRHFRAAERAVFGRLFEDT
ncbi:bacterio-opsin activator domain-containing protein [Halovivax gelatinilyticus]|uniref:bacterio-opsin activator domain-containing protein n=1 Tax=Halovivax gelatinilyticus TaxID=2961597 RepID=UPI0020CA40F1|nr:bacterio-opsin activator domain-containing protein [Halovivax gelatinilyticus]